jgi:hypothetical protein
MLKGVAMATQVYYGPAAQATAHLAHLGHPCPPTYNPADFLSVCRARPHSALARPPHWPGAHH